MVAKDFEEVAWLSSCPSLLIIIIIRMRPSVRGMKTSTGVGSAYNILSFTLNVQIRLRIVEGDGSFSLKHQKNIINLLTPISRNRSSGVAGAIISVTKVISHKSRLLIVFKCLGESARGAIGKGVKVAQSLSRLILQGAEPRVRLAKKDVSSSCFYLFMSCNVFQPWLLRATREKSPRVGK